MSLTVSSYTQIESYEFWSQQLHSITRTPLTGRTLFAKSDTQSIDYYRVCVIDINGTKTGVIVGTPTNVDVADSVDMLLMDIDVAPLTADGTDGAVYYMDDVAFQNNIEANTFSIDGSRNITLNTVLEIPTDSGAEDHVSVDRIDDTHILIVHNKYVGGGGRVNCYILTESGGTLSASAALTLTSDSQIDSKVAATVLSATRAMVFYEDDVNGVQVALVNISGANPTLTDGPDQVEASSTLSYNHFHKIGDKLDSTHAVVTYMNGTNAKLKVIQNNSDVLTQGSAVTDNSSNDRLSVAGADGVRFAVAHRSSGKVSTYSVSSNTITSNGDEINLPNNPTPNAPNRSVVAFAQMDGADYLWISTHGDVDETLWAAQIRDVPGIEVDVDTLTLASTPQALNVDRPVFLPGLTLASSAEGLNVIPVTLSSLSLTVSPEVLTVIPIYLNTLTLASSAEIIQVGQAFGVNALTLVSAPQSLTVVPGEATVTLAALTLASSAETIQASAPAVIGMDALTLVSSAVTVARVQVFIFSPTEINNLRLAAHKQTARMTIFAPPVLWTGVVNGVHDRGEVDIVYDGGSGALTFVRDFLQIKIGTVSGGDDVGRLRVDNVGSMTLTTGTITVDENGIPWLDGMFLSIEHLFPIERIPPRIAGSVLYKYYDLAYTDENGQDNTEPVCLAGCDQVAELVAGSHVFNIDLSNSYPTTSGVITSYTLSVAPTLGAVVSFNTGTGIGTVTVSQAGYWWAICSCTDSLGNVMERFVLLRAHDSTDTDFIEVVITGYTEIWGRGVQLSLQARSNIALSDVPDNAIAYLWHENEFDGAEGYVNILGIHDTILFNGYVRSDKSVSDLQSGDKSADFQLTTVDGLMESLPLRSISLRLKSQPSDWWQYQLLTTGEAIWFLLRWHTTVPWRHDVIGLESFDKTTYRLAADFEEGSVFAAANRVAFDSGVVARITCDRLGRLHFVQDTQLLNEVERNAIVSAFDIQPGDVSGRIEIVREPEPAVHTVQVSGFSYDSSGDGTPYISIAPGYRPASISYSMPERRGRSFKNVPHQLLASQTEANQRSGRYLARANMAIKQLRITFRGNYLTALTTIPSYGWYEMNVTNTDLARALDIDELRLLCRSIQARIDSETGVFSVIGIFEPEAQGPDGIVGNYPGAQGELALEVPPEDVQDPAEAVLVTQSVSLRRSNPESVIEDTWTVLEASARTYAIIDPWWKVINVSDDPDDIIWLATDGSTIELTDELAGTTTDITPTNDPPNSWSDGVAPTVGDLIYVQLLGDLWVQNRFYVVAEYRNNDDWRAWIGITSNAGTSWTWLDLTSGYSVGTGGRIRNIAVNGTYLLLVYWLASSEILGVETLRAYTKSTLIGAYSAGCNTNNGPNGGVTLTHVTGVIDDDSLWFIYGNFNGGINGISGASQAQIHYTVDAGLSAAVYEGDWTPNHCKFLKVGTLNTAGSRQVFAFKG